MYSQVSSDAVKTNFSRMHKDMAVRLAAFARTEASIALHMRCGSDGVTVLLIADVVAGSGESISRDRLSFFLKDEDRDLVSKITTCLNSGKNSQILGRKALASLCARYA